MNKKVVRQTWGRISIINTWYFLGLSLFFVLIGVLALRHSNIRSIELRDAVLQADKENKDVEEPLRELREHMYSHMNSSLSSGSMSQPIQLKYRYERLVEAEKQKTGNGDEVYAQAQAYCEQRHGAGDLRSGRVPCVQEYIAQHSQSSGEVNIPESLYKFNFVSPTWSPDLAGWSLLLGAVFFVFFALRFLVERWFKTLYKDL